VYVFADLRSYRAYGGMPNSAGVFMGDRLMIFTGGNLNAWTWHTIQHEGFHQFAYAAIGTRLPIWANEGLAEYFGHGIYTGDNFMTGFIPPERLKRIKAGIQEEKFKPLLTMMRLPHEIWNAEVMLAAQQASWNYDQAWAMVHFLAHADNGKYQKPFSNFLSAVSHGQDWEQAWTKTFGGDVSAFDARWREYWLNLPDNPTEDLYAEATAATLTSFFARAFSQRQFFETFDEFKAAAEAGALKYDEEDWLPPELLANALKNADQYGTWSVVKKPGRRLLVCERPDGTVLEGSFKVRNKRVQNVEVNTRAPRKSRK